MQPAIQPTLYESLETLPENIIGELLNGQLYTQPRPSWAHAMAGSVLGVELGGPFHRGKGGPGGWWIIDEPEVHFVRNVEVVVPDLAGWRRERMPYPPEDQAGVDQVSVPPFESVLIDLEGLWLPRRPRLAKS